MLLLSMAGSPKMRFMDIMAKLVKLDPKDEENLLDELENAAESFRRASNFSDMGTFPILMHNLSLSWDEIIFCKNLWCNGEKVLTRTGNLLKFTI